MKSRIIFLCNFRSALLYEIFGDFYNKYSRSPLCIFRYLPKYTYVLIYGIYIPPLYTNLLSEKMANRL